jgi:hypothetical protein
VVATGAAEPAVALHEASGAVGVEAASGGAGVVTIVVVVADEGLELAVGGETAACTAKPPVRVAKVATLNPAATFRACSAG